MVHKWCCAEGVWTKHCSLDRHLALLLNLAGKKMKRMVAADNCDKSKRMLLEMRQEPAAASSIAAGQSPSSRSEAVGAERQAIDASPQRFR